jgi:RNA 3'-terminal phosphate cyclase-like protein
MLTVVWWLGTSILYKPGAIMGGRIEHDCGTERSISYFLEPLLVLAPFSKKPFALTLEGITTDHIDPSVSGGFERKEDSSELMGLFCY